MKIILRVERFNPEIDKEPRFQEYGVEVEPTDRLLDALIQVKQFQDGTLGFRKSCAHGVCGSDAMRINGKEGLACKTLIQDVAHADGVKIEIKPLQNMPVQRDLIVDQKEFFSRYRSVQPFLINTDPVPEKERLQSPEERKNFDDATSCILCASCFSACPISEDNKNFIGPAALVQGYRFIADSRDKGFEDRLPELDHPDGAWACQNHFKCTEVCPRHIKVTKRINQTKKMIKDYREARKESVNDSSCGKK